MTVKYVMTFLDGTVELGKPTGRWIKCEHGWYEEYSDCITRDGKGAEVRRDKTEPYIYLNMDPSEILKKRLTLKVNDIMKLWAAILIIVGSPVIVASLVWCLAMALRHVR